MQERYESAYSTDGRYGQLSKHVRCRMTKYKVANSGRKEHIPGEIAEKWETRTLMNKAPMGDSQPVQPVESSFYFILYIN